MANRKTADDRIRQLLGYFICAVATAEFRVVHVVRYKLLRFSLLHYNNCTQAYNCLPRSKRDLLAIVQLLVLVRCAKGCCEVSYYLKCTDLHVILQKFRGSMFCSTVNLIHPRNTPVPRHGNPLSISWVAP